MEFKLDNVLCLFLVVAFVGWVIFKIGVRLLSWLVGRLIGSAISFQLAGLYHLTNVSIQFPKGWIAAVVIGGVKIVAAAPSRPTTDGTTLQDHKRQLLISHLEVLFRGLKHQGRLDDEHDPHMTHMNSSSSFHRHWVILTKIAKYFNFSISELVLKYIEMPKVSMEIKLLEFHVHREPGASNSVWTKIQLCTIYVGEKQSLVEDSSISKFQRMFTGTRTFQLPAPEIVPESTYFVCFLLDHLSTTCYVDDHDRYYCEKPFLSLHWTRAVYHSFKLTTLYQILVAGAYKNEYLQSGFLWNLLHNLTDTFLLIMFK